MMNIKFNQILSVSVQWLDMGLSAILPQCMHSGYSDIRAGQYKPLKNNPQTAVGMRIWNEILTRVSPWFFDLEKHNSPTRQTATTKRLLQKSWSLCSYSAQAGGGTAHPTAQPPMFYNNSAGFPTPAAATEASGKTGGGKMLHTAERRLPHNRMMFYSKTRTVSTGATVRFWLFQVIGRH